MRDLRGTSERTRDCQASGTKPNFGMFHQRPLRRHKSDQLWLGVPMMAILCNRFAIRWPAACNDNFLVNSDCARLARVWAYVLFSKTSRINVAACSSDGSAQRLPWV